MSLRLHSGSEAVSRDDCEIGGGVCHALGGGQGVKGAKEREGGSGGSDCDPPPISSTAVAGEGVLLLDKEVEGGGAGEQGAESDESGDELVRPVVKRAKTRVGVDVEGGVTVGAGGSGAASRHAVGTQLTCFTSTKIQILTQKALQLQSLLWWLAQGGQVVLFFWLPHFVFANPPFFAIPLLRSHLRNCYVHHPHYAAAYVPLLILYSAYVLLHVLQTTYHCMHMQIYRHIYIYIYIERERERESQRQRQRQRQRER